MKFLLIETSSINCSVAVSVHQEIVAVVERKEANIHASSITLFISEVMQIANLKLEELDAIVVGKGPGSYTGLRIGVSTAKGLCYALNKPLLSCNTLETLFLQAKEMLALEHANYFPMVDARRMEVYTCEYNANGMMAGEIKAEIITEQSYVTHLSKSTCVFFGDGSLKLKSFYENNENAIFLDDVYPSAKHMLAPAIHKYKQQEYEDVAYFEPYYLKEFYFNK